MHRIFADDMKHVPPAKYLLDEFLEKYSRDFDILLFDCSSSSQITLHEMR